MPIPVILETYGKAVICKGDTRCIKDFLKGQGGRWNPKCTGWMFPGSKKDTLMTALQGNPLVEQVVDKTGQAGSAAPANASSASSSAAPAAKAVAPASKTRGAPNDDASPGESDDTVFEIGNSTRATVSSFMGHVGVDVRKFYTAAGESEMRPTAKGVRLNIAEWEGLCEKFGEIDGASGEETKITLVKDIVVTVKPDMVDIRKFYTDKVDGELKPTKKGICLQKGDWSKLKGLAAQIAEEIAKPRSGRSAPPPKKKQKTKAAEPEEGGGEAPASSPEKDGANMGRQKLRKTLVKLLGDRDLSTLTPKLVRAELETKLSLPEGALDDRKNEIKGILTDIIQASE